ncbi:hypothetical protein IAS59_001250 [Cryptococcus gattii]
MSMMRPSKATKIIVHLGRYFRWHRSTLCSCVSLSLPGCLGHTLFLDKAVQPVPEGSWSTVKPEKGPNLGNLSTSVHLAYSPGYGSQIRCP